jgi:mono/diheme cytochrome c family protein
LMNTALSRVTPLEPPPQSGGPKICFNPFLEETQFNGVVSNCIQCHRRAAYNPETDKITEGKDLGLTWRDGKTPANGTQPNPHYFDDALRTDYIWSISTAQDTELRDFVMQLNTFLQTMSSH